MSSAFTDVKVLKTSISLPVSNYLRLIAPNLVPSDCD